MAFLPNPPLTRDQVRLMKGDNVVDGNALILQDLGIVPASVEEIMPTYINAGLESSVC
jgi:NADH dehydrogenase